MQGAALASQYAVVYQVLLIVAAIAVSTIAYMVTNRVVSGKCKPGLSLCNGAASLLIFYGIFCILGLLELTQVSGLWTFIRLWDSSLILFLILMSMYHGIWYEKNAMKYVPATMVSFVFYVTVLYSIVFRYFSTRSF